MLRSGFFFLIAQRGKQKKNEADSSHSSAFKQPCQHTAPEFKGLGSNIWISYLLFLVSPAFWFPLKPEHNSWFSILPRPFQSPSFKFIASDRQQEFMQPSHFLYSSLSSSRVLFFLFLTFSVFPLGKSDISAFAIYHQKKFTTVRICHLAVITINSCWWLNYVGNALAAGSSCVVQ